MSTTDDAGEYLTLSEALTMSANRITTPAELDALPVGSRFLDRRVTVTMTQVNHAAQTMYRRNPRKTGEFTGRIRALYVGEICDALDALGIEVQG